MKGDDLYQKDVAKAKAQYEKDSANNKAAIQDMINAHTGGYPRSHYEKMLKADQDLLVKKRDQEIAAAWPRYLRRNWVNSTVHWDVQKLTDSQVSWVASQAKVTKTSVTLFYKQNPGFQALSALTLGILYAAVKGAIQVNGFEIDTDKFGNRLNDKGRPKDDTVTANAASDSETDGELQIQAEEASAEIAALAGEASDI